MEITWHGQSCFTIKGENVTIVTSPFGEIGLKMPELKGDIVTVSQDNSNHNNIEAVIGEKKILDWPGEYEVKGIHIQAIECYESKNIIFCFELEGMNVCHLGDITEKIPNEIVEEMGDVDILFIPVGDGETMNAKKAHELIEQIDPRMVIPMKYSVPDLKEKLDPIENFLKEVGHKEMEPQKKLRIKKADLPEDKTEFIVMEL